MQAYNNVEKRIIILTINRRLVMKKFFSSYNIAIMALFVALLAICSWISLPIGPVPFTLQTFAVFVVGGLLGFKRGTVTVVVYILLGLVGVPVFSGFKGGVGVIVGPTGGYILGFILTEIVISLGVKFMKVENEALKMLVMFVFCVIGDALCFVVGTIQFMAVTGNILSVSLTYCVIPYIIPDIVKIIVAVIVVNRVKKYVSIFND